MELRDFLIKAKKATYAYTFNVNGDLECFDGIEEIRKDGKLIYRLHCTGGKII